MQDESEQTDTLHIQISRMTAVVQGVPKKVPLNVCYYTFGNLNELNIIGGSIFIFTLSKWYNKKD